MKKIVIKSGKLAAPAELNDSATADAIWKETGRARVPCSHVGWSLRLDRDGSR